MEITHVVPMWPSVVWLCLIAVSLLFHTLLVLLRPSNKTVGNWIGQVTFVGLGALILWIGGFFDVLSY